MQKTRFRRRPPSLRESLEASNKADRYLAAMAGVPPRAQSFVPEKRAYTKRTDGSSEHAEQVAVVQWWRKACGAYKLPEFALFSVPNGAYLASGYMGASKLKAEGMRPGMLDLILAVPRDQFHGLMLEMKYGSNTPSPEQWAVKAYLESAGYSTAVHWSADSAIAHIKEYLA